MCMARKRTQEYCRISSTMTQPCAIMRAELVWLFVWFAISKGANITTDVLLKICKPLDCTLEDIMETVKD